MRDTKGNTMAINIADTITSNGMTEDMLKKYNSIISVMRETYAVGKVSVTPAMAEKYKGDMYGLFKNEFSIAETDIYLHIRINGYLSSDDYNGELLELQILDNSQLLIYRSLFKKT